MDKKLPIIIGTVVVIIALVVLGFFWKNSQNTSATPTPKPEYVQQESSIEMVDLKTQPQWVQDLKVSAKRGKSPNGLENFTLSIAGLDKGVTGITYTIEYQTTDKGIQGTFSSKPVETLGKTEVILKTIDLGTCSTKSCVRHNGVKELIARFDFETKDSSAVWTGTIPLE